MMIFTQFGHLDWRFYILNPMLVTPVTKNFQAILKKTDVQCARNGRKNMHGMKITQTGLASSWPALLTRDKNIYTQN